MKGNLILYSRTVYKDYRWVFAPTYLDSNDKKFLRDLFNIFHSNKSTFENNLPPYFLYKLSKHWCVIKFTETKRKDRANRRIFALEGLACKEKKNAKLLLANFPKIINKNSDFLSTTNFLNEDYFEDFDNNSFEVELSIEAFSYPENYYQNKELDNTNLEYDHNINNTDLVFNTEYDHMEENEFDHYPAKIEEYENSKVEYEKCESKIILIDNNKIIRQFISLFKDLPGNYYLAVFDSVNGNIIDKEKIFGGIKNNEFIPNKRNDNFDFMEETKVRINATFTKLKTRLNNTGWVEENNNPSYKWQTTFKKRK